MTRSARCLAGLLALAAPLSAAAVDLRPKFKTGQELYFLNTSDVTQSMLAADAQAPGMESAMKSETGMRLKVLETRPDGGAQIEWTVLFMTMSMTGGPMPMDYDSRDPARQSGMVAPMIKPMIDTPALITVNAQGEVTDFKGLDSSAMGPMGQLIGQFFSKEAFQQMALIPTAGAPNPAEPGATWTQHLELDLPQGMGTMIYDTDYKLARVDAGANRAVIEVKGKPSIKQPPAGEPQPMMSIDKGETTGTIQWDLAQGQMHSAENSADLAMTMTAPGGKMNMTQKVKSSVRQSNLAEFKLPATSEAKPATDS